jgi:formylglycine-generating enzyme required for sulfatase activity
VYDVDEIDGIHFYTMAYLEGTLLFEKTAAGEPWPVAQAVDMVRRVALAVAELHRRGIVHRDLKPANIMLRPSGEPVLMDFGLACSLTAESQRLTAAGQGQGTLAYMPIEQLEGDRARQGPASDVFSLGLILYELLTGSLPFEGAPLSVMQLGNKVLEPPSRGRAGLDARLDAICLKALAKDPADRFPDMNSFAAALAEFLSGPAQQRLHCPHCGKGLKVPASMAGKRLKCPQCGTSLATATKVQPRPVPSPAFSETVPPSFRETAARPKPRMAPAALPGPPVNTPSRSNFPSEPDTIRRVRPVSAARRNLRGPVFLIAGVCALLLASVLLVLAFRDDGSPRQKSTSKKSAKETGAQKANSEAVQRGLLQEQFKNALDMQLVLIKKDTFKMGSPDDDKDKYKDEVPQHLVRIKKDFYIGATEVTVGQFRQFVKEESYKTEAEKANDASTWQNNKYSTEDDQPVVYVTWNDAMAVCEWLSKKEKKNYDLPYEAEWEFACRAGGKAEDVYCFGSDREKLGEYAWYTENSHGRTHPVGTKKPNAWGLYDMHGNALEWCKDGPRKYPDQEKEPIEDYEGPLNGNRRVLRGGSWDVAPRVCRSAVRGGGAPDHRLDCIGFRVVCRPGPWAR